jgi:hypothetical protein
MHCHTFKLLLGASVLALAGMGSPAQQGQDHSEHLNYVAGDAAMPSFADSVIDENSSYRRALFSRGMALRVINQYQYAQNILGAPVAPDEQVYVGQRAYTSVMFSRFSRQIFANCT